MSWGTFTLEVKATLVKVRRTQVKYSPVGGFTPARMGANLPDRIQEALCRAANGSLAASTWKKYEGCWRNVQKLVEERGMKVKFPLTRTSLRIVMGVLVESGRKPGTIEGYLASLKTAHKVRGLDDSVFEDPLVKAAVKGLRNVAALEPKIERVCITALTMKRWRMKVKNMGGLPYVDRRMVWLALVWIYCGSLRPSELLAEAEDVTGLGIGTKALRWKSITRKEEKNGGTKEEVVQIRLTAPKTVTTMPVQVVALPAISSVLCPVSAWKAFVKAGKNIQERDDLVFRWSNGKPFTIRELGKFMANWSGQEAKATPKDLRAALPSLLARKGVREETLKMLGRWSSSAFNSYIRQGRANSWADAKAALQLALL